MYVYTCMYVYTYICRVCIKYVEPIVVYAMYIHTWMKIQYVECRCYVYTYMNENTICRVYPHVYYGYTHINDNKICRV